MAAWHIYKLNIRSEISGPLSQNFRGPKRSKFRHDFMQLLDFIANISGTQRDIVKRKTTLQTEITPTHTYLIW